MRHIRRRSRQPGVAACAIALVVLAPAALDAQVFVHGQEHGQGLLRARNQECFVITPFHVVNQVEDEARIQLVAQGRVERYARFDADYGSDVAVLRVEADRPLACPSEWDPGERLSELLRNALEGVIETIGEDGSPQRRFVRITGYNDRSVAVRAVQGGDALRQGLSGSRLVIAGVPAGTLLEVNTKSGEGMVLRGRSGSPIRSGVGCLCSPRGCSSLSFRTSSRSCSWAAPGSRTSGAVGCRDGRSEGCRCYR